MHDAFVSYASSDRTVAEAVRSKLQDAELGCWMAPHDIVAGTTWAEAIIEGVQASRSMVVVFSSRSNASSQVMREVDRAVAHKLPLVTFRIEDCRPTRAMEYFLSAQHWLDAFPEPGESHLAALADAVRRIAAAEDDLEAEGARVLLEAAEAGDVAAATNLGLQALDRGDREDAQRWFRQAAESGDPIAATNLGLHAMGQNDSREAWRWLMVGAEGGDVMAATNLGLLAQEDNNVDEALHWLGLGAAGGDAMAATNLGMMLRDHRDRHQGIEWLERGAAGGDVLAASELARMARGEA